MDAFVSLEEVRWKCLLNKGLEKKNKKKKEKPLHITQALDLTTLLMFTDLLIVNFLRFTRTMTKGLLSIKLGIVPNHGRIRVKTAALIKTEPK